MDVHQHLKWGIVMLDGNIVITLDIDSCFKESTIVLSEELLDAKGLRTIAFSSENAVAPFDAGTGEDKRELGIALSMITFEKASIAGEGL